MFTQTGGNVLSSGCLKINLLEGDAITLESVYPMSDEEGRILAPYVFKLKNTCNDFASYQINLEILNDSTLENLTFMKVMLNDEVHLLEERDKVLTTLSNARQSYQLQTGYLDALEEKDFSLRLWLSFDTPVNEEFMNKVFLSKITVTANYLEKYEKEAPVINASVLKRDGKIILDASASLDDSGILAYYFSTDNVNWVEKTEPFFEVDYPITYGLATAVIENIFLNNPIVFYVKAKDRYGNMSDAKEVFFNELIVDESCYKNIRYVGQNPDNYVLFNNELWRIIGVMNHTLNRNNQSEKRLKIVRNTSLGSYSYDSCDESVNRGYGVNEWIYSSANILLNEMYYESMSNQSCHIGSNMKTRKCSFSSTGLKEESKKMIDDAWWFLGTIPTFSDGGDEQAFFKSLKIRDFYQYERSNNTGKICNGGVYCNDIYDRQSKWLGQVGLISPSDYIYSVEDDVNRRADFLANSVDQLQQKHSWLLLSSAMWMLNSFPRLNSASDAFLLSNGALTNYRGSNTASIHPVVYLTKNVSINSGTGSILNPYNLTIN